MKGIYNPPPLKKSGTENSEFRKAVQLLVKEIFPPDDVAVEDEHVEVVESKHWPDKTIGQACH